MNAATLERLKNGFDSVALLDKDATLDLSFELWQTLEDDAHVLIWHKRHPDLGVGYVLMPIPDPALLDADELLVAKALEAANESYAVAIERATKERP